MTNNSGPSISLYITFPIFDSGIFCSWLLFFSDLEPGQQYIVALTVGIGSVEGESIIFIEKTRVQIFVKVGCIHLI